MLQATNDIVGATPAPIQCRDGEYVESDELCSDDATGQEEPASCSGGGCNNNGSGNSGKCKVHLFIAHDGRANRLGTSDR